MAVTIPLLREKTNKDGRTRFYWEPSATLRKAGFEPIPLGRHREAAFAAAIRLNADVEKWKAGGGGPAHVRHRSKRGTLGALIEKYTAERIEGIRPDGRPWLAPGTIGQYRPALARLKAWAGDKSIDWVTPLQIRKLRERLMGPPAKGGLGHHAAYDTMKMGRTLFLYAIGEDIVDQGRNPFDKHGIPRPGPRDTIWSPPAREALVAAALDLGLVSIALACQLGFAIGQRPQDFRALLVSKYKEIKPHEMQREDHAALSALSPDGVVRGVEIHQLKTKAWVKSPIVGELRAAVEANIARARAGGVTTILIDEKRSAPGAMRSYAGASGKNAFDDDFAACRAHAIARAIADGDTELAAELPTLQFRDMRRTCVVYYGELGFDAASITAITGHDIDETAAILKTYLPRTTGRAARVIAIAAEREAREAKTAKEN